MRVYVVSCETGEYSDALRVIEGIFSSEEAAVAHIESQEMTFFEPDEYPGELWEPWHADFDGEDEGEGERELGRLVSRAPTRHPPLRNGLPGALAHDSWYVDGDRTYDAPTWFIDEFEVIE